MRHLLSATTRRFGCLLLCLTAGSALAADPEAWVRQTDLENGLIYDIPLGANGGPFTAPLPVGQLGSRFELFARGTAWDSKIYLLDTKLIRAYAPTVSVQISSEDSYVRGDPASGNYVKRTRADRPFQLSLEVSGLVAGSTDPAEQFVYFACEGRLYDTQTFSSTDTTQLIHETNLENGTLTAAGMYHELPTATVSGGCGEQKYTFVRYAADGVPDTILAQPKIEVWPVAKAAVANITQGQVFIDRIPSLLITLQALYPDSYTYAQIYEGTAALGTTGTIIRGTERRQGAHYNPDLAGQPTNVPQNVTLTVDDLSNYTAKDGVYTLEIITHTPFFNRAAERLLSITFEVDRVISSRGQLSTAEKPAATQP